MPRGFLTVVRGLRVREGDQRNKECVRNRESGYGSKEVKLRVRETEGVASNTTRVGGQEYSLEEKRAIKFIDNVDGELSEQPSVDLCFLYHTCFTIDSHMIC